MIWQPALVDASHFASTLDCSNKGTRRVTVAPLFNSTATSRVYVPPGKLNASMAHCHCVKAPPARLLILPGCAPTLASLLFNSWPLILAMPALCKVGDTP